MSIPSYYHEDDIETKWFDHRSRRLKFQAAHDRNQRQEKTKVKQRELEDA